MNYRHAFHAGNPGDVLKHMVLVALLTALSRKPKPWCYLDTHAGAGDYDLSARSAQRSGEYRAGIGTLWNWSDPPAGPIADYLALVRAHAGGGTAGAPARYPGSPVLARALVRAGDRMVLCETEPSAHAALKARFRGDAQVAVHRRDGYEALGALLPPPERRGLVLVDPPYEAPGELARLPGALATAQARFTAGVCALWYPHKDPAAIAAFLRALRASGLGQLLHVELRTTSLPLAGVLTGSGMVILNPPHRLDATLRECLPPLAQRLAGSAGAAAVNWLAPSAAHD